MRERGGRGKDSRSLYLSVVALQKSGLMVWNHPIDLHYYTNTVQEWPRLVLHLWTLDTFGQKQLCTSHSHQPNPSVLVPCVASLTALGFVWYGLQWVMAWRFCRARAARMSWKCRAGDHSAHQKRRSTVQHIPNAMQLNALR
jgi:hypothetical protein